MKGSLRVCAISLILVGAMLLTGPMFGFSTLDADRGVNVTTSDASNALLSIDATGETPTNQEDAEVLVIRNNANERFEPLVTNVTLNTERLAVNNDFDTSLDSDGTTGLELTCERGANNRQATVTVEADAFGSNLQIEGVTYEYTFQYSCSGGGGGGSDPGGFQNVNAGAIQGTTQTLSFTMDGPLPKGETVSLGLSAYGVNYSGAEIDTIASPHKHDVAEFVEQEDGSTTIEFRPHNRLKAGDEVTITITGIETDSWWVGALTATESASGQTGIDMFSGSNMFSAASTTDTNSDESLAITESDLERMANDLEHVDDASELRPIIEEMDDVEIIDETS